MMSKEGDIDWKEIFEMLFMEMAVIMKRKISSETPGVTIGVP